MKCKIDNLVREAVASLDAQSTVQEAVEMMADQNVGSLVVTSNGEVIGLFTERDLINRVVSQGKDARNTRLEDAATTECLVSISSEASCNEAILKMKSNDCRRLLVYGSSGFVGIVSLPNVAHALAQLAQRESGRNLIASVFVAITIAASLAMIVMVVYLLPGIIGTGAK